MLTRVGVVEATQAVIARLLDEARASAPNEACGLLFGTVSAGLERITEARPTANVAPEPTRHFEIDPRALIAAYRQERRQERRQEHEGGDGARLLGFYHSHPTGSAEPSATDRECSAGDGRIWAIVAGGEVRFWRDGAGGFEALSLRVLEG